MSLARIAEIQAERARRKHEHGSADEILKRISNGWPVNRNELARIVGASERLFRVKRVRDFTSHSVAGNQFFYEDFRALVLGATIDFPPKSSSAWTDSSVLDYSIAAAVKDEAVQRRLSWAKRRFGRRKRYHSGRRRALRVKKSERMAAVRELVQQTLGRARTE
jgi:hypothetical protein